MHIIFCWKFDFSITLIQKRQEGRAIKESISLGFFFRQVAINEQSFSDYLVVGRIILFLNFDRNLRVTQNSLSVSQKPFLLVVQALHYSGSHTAWRGPRSWEGSRDWFSTASGPFGVSGVLVALLQMGLLFFTRYPSIHARTWSVSMFCQYRPKLLHNLLQRHFRTRYNVPAHYFGHSKGTKSKQIKPTGPPSGLGPRPAEAHSALRPLAAIQQARSA